MQVDLYDGHKTVAVVFIIELNLTTVLILICSHLEGSKIGTDQFMGESGPHSLTPYIEFTKHVTTGTA